MTFRVATCVAVLVASCVVVQARAEENVPPEGFTALFNGKDISGFYGWGTRDPRDLTNMSADEQAAYKERSIKGGGDSKDHLEAHWWVEDGELVNDGTGLYATTDRDYRDFELYVDYKILPKGDSGIYLRGIPQVQIWDPTNEDAFKNGADKGSGALWNNSADGKFPLKKMDRPLGEWNTVHVTMIGERVTVELNGEVVVDDAALENYYTRSKKPDPVPNGFFPDPAFPTGPIQLQTHGSEVRWKNVFVREIGAEEANAWLASRDADGFEELVNGKDLSAWQGAVESYEVKDGAIVCKPGKGGDLLSKEEFENGTIRIEFKLPEAGNNGIALRTPLGGHSASDGLELQVIDTDGYNKRLAAGGGGQLAPYQTHGSLYHCVGAKTGYLRPAGEWNFQEIEVEGQRIRVTLNGTKILDVDIDSFDRSQIAHPPKGLDRRSGLVGLAGHSDPVAFRSFKVRRQ
jgi:hypothetical protein